MKTFDWEIDDYVVSKTNRFNLIRGKEYLIVNDTGEGDIFVIKNDLGESMDFADFWFCKKVDKN
jgi:hypothetical protein